jgi:hypothetical protein
MLPSAPKNAFLGVVTPSPAPKNVFAGYVDCYSNPAPFVGAGYLLARPGKKNIPTNRL